MLIHRPRPALFHIEHLVDELHGAGPVDGEQVDDVIDLLDGILAAGFDHAAGFQLEHAHGFPAVEQFESFPIFQRNRLDREIRRVPADVLHGLVDDREVLQAEEIHLQQAHVGDGLHVILGDDFAFVTTGERDVFV